MASHVTPAPTDYFIARIVVLVARQAGVTLDQAEVLQALLVCGPKPHTSCRVDALIRRKAEEQGVPWPDTESP